MTAAAGSAGALVEAALDIARGLESGATALGDGLTWEAEIAVGSDEDRPVLGYGDVGETLYDGTAGIALGLAACATVARPPEASAFSDAARGAACHALAGGPDLLEAGRVGLFDGATGIALGVATTGRVLDDTELLERAAALAGDVAGRVETQAADPSSGIELDLIGGLAGVALGLQSVAGMARDTQLLKPLPAVGGLLADAAAPQTWGSAWPTGAGLDGAPPLLGLGHGAAGIALALGEVAALSGDARVRRACNEGLEYERGWFDPDRVAWPDLRDAGPAADPPGWMAAWCHGAVGIGFSRLRLTRLNSDPLALVEASAALQAARNLAVSAGTALRGGRESDCTSCHGLAGVVELLLVAAQALEVAEHARAARRVAGQLLEQRDAAGGAWSCGLPGAGEIPGLMTGTAGIALTLLRAAGAVNIPTPLLPGSSGW